MSFLLWLLLGPPEAGMWPSSDSFPVNILKHSLIISSRACLLTHTFPPTLYSLRHSYDAHNHIYLCLCIINQETPPHNSTPRRPFSTAKPTKAHPIHSTAPHFPPLNNLLKTPNPSSHSPSPPPPPQNPPTNPA